MAKLLKILIHPHQTLRNKSKKINLEDIAKPKTQNLLLDMELTMIENNGAGLAAPQVGLNLRAITVRDEDKTFFMINPSLIKKSWARVTEDEGCLSIVNKKGEILYGPVPRHKKITCAYYDTQGKRKTIQAEGLLARIIQHEIDHLDGILFIDYLGDLEAKPYQDDNNQAPA